MNIAEGQVWKNKKNEKRIRVAHAGPSFVFLTNVETKKEARVSLGDFVANFELER